MRTLPLWTVLLLCACRGGASPAPRAQAGPSPVVPAVIDSLRCGSDRNGYCTLYDVSLAELITVPERFDGKRVRVVGYAHFEFEGSGLYLHREDSEHLLTKNGVWLTTPAHTDLRRVNDRYVLVEGLFVAREHGHMGMWSGTIREVTRLDPWRAGEAPTKTPVAQR